MLGTIVVRSAGCVINDFADRKIDPHVERTADRPLATGEVAPVEALILFAALMLIALGLVLTLNRLTVLLAVAGAAVTVVYPFTKRFLSAPQFVLGIAFAWGVPMAFAAELGEVPRVGWLLFLAAVIWVIVYDTQYAMADRDDDLRIGVRSTAILFGDLDRAFIGGAAAAAARDARTSSAAARSSGLGTTAGSRRRRCSGSISSCLIRDREPASCFRAFLNNAWLGGAVFCGIALDYLFRRLGARLAAESIPQLGVLRARSIEPPACARRPRPRSARHRPRAAAAASAFTVAPVVITSSTIAIRDARDVAARPRTRPRRCAAARPPR